MINKGQELGIETIIKSAHKLIEYEIDARPEVYLLLDTNLAIYSSFCNGTYHSKDYSGLNSKELENAIKAVRFGSALLDNPIIFIVDGVAEEINNFSKIVSERMKFYNKSTKEGKQKNKKEKFHSQNLENNKNLFEELNDVCFCFSKKLNKAIYPIENTIFYDQILDEVLKITKEKNLTREIFVDEQIPRPFRRDHDKFHADEELIALAMYLNATRDRPVSILSKDSDIPRILKRVPLSSFIEHPSVRVLNPYGKAVNERGYN